MRYKLKSSMRYKIRKFCENFLKKMKKIAVESHRKKNSNDKIKYLSVQMFTDPVSFFALE